MTCKVWCCCPWLFPAQNLLKGTLRPNSVATRNGAALSGKQCGLSVCTWVSDRITYWTFWGFGSLASGLVPDFTFRYHSPLLFETFPGAWSIRSPTLVAEPSVKGRLGKERGPFPLCHTDRNLWSTLNTCGQLRVNLEDRILRHGSRDWERWTHSAKLERRGSWLARLQQAS